MFIRNLNLIWRFASTKKSKSLYDILKIAKNANSDEIKASYYKLAKEYHPDTHQGSPSVAETFKEINEAYNVLRDPQKRKQYDQQNFTSEGEKKEYKFYDAQHSYGYNQKFYRKNPYQTKNPFQSTFHTQNPYREPGSNPYYSDFNNFYKPSQNQKSNQKDQKAENWEEYVRQEHRKNVAENRKMAMNRLKRSNTIMLIIMGVVSVYLIGELTFKIYEFNNAYRVRSYAEKLDPRELQEFQEIRRTSGPRKDYY